MNGMLKPCSGIFTILALILTLISLGPAKSQERGGNIKGFVIDQITGVPVAGAKIQIAGTASQLTTATGEFNIQVSEDLYTVIITATGYDSSTIRKVRVLPNQATSLMIKLHSFPDTTYASYRRDTSEVQKPPISLNSGSSRVFDHSHALGSSLKGEHQIKHLPLQNPLYSTTGLFLNRIPQVYGAGMKGNPYSSGQPTLSIAGMEDRYSQICLNGMPVQDLFGYKSIQLLYLLPIQLIEQASVSYAGSTNVPGNRAGGTLLLDTKKSVDGNFILFELTGGTFNDLSTQTYMTEKWTNQSWMGIPGKATKLPSNFPTTRSRYTLDQYNAQERTNQIRKMNNTFPLEKRQTWLPEWGFTFGIGKKFQLKQSRVLSLTFLAQQKKVQTLEQSEMQLLPNVKNNPFPFTSSLPVLRTASSDNISRYLGSSAIGLNFELASAKASYSWQNTLINFTENSYFEKTGVFKPDEDTSARTAIIAGTQHKAIFMSQLSGIHILKPEKNFQLLWNAGYAFADDKLLDQRNFLFQQSASDPTLVRLATQSAASLQNTLLTSSNSGRSWAGSQTHNFTGQISLRAPLWIKKNQNLLEGGVWFNSQYHSFYRDTYLYSSRRSLFQPLDSILSPDTYYPAGTDVINFYQKLESSSLPYANDFSDIENLNNFISSQNTGAVYLKVTHHLPRSTKITWGLRAESNSQLVSNVQYQYTEFVKDPQKYTISLNSRINSLDILPQIQAETDIVGNLKLQLGYNRTVTRPSLEELSRSINYDPTLFTFTQGNLALENTIQEYVSAGLHFATSHHSLINASTFYRFLDRPVENRVNQAGSGLQIITPYNMPSAEVRGLMGSFQFSFGEFLRSRFARSLMIFGHGVIQDSKVKAGPVKGSEDVMPHELAGTPPYLFTAGVTITDSRFPNLSINFQQIGDHRIMIGSGNDIILLNSATIREIPDVRRATSTSLNIQVSQSLFRSRLLIATGIKNLQTGANIIYQDLNGNGKLDIPIKTRVNNKGVYQTEGIDNTLWNTNSTRNYYITISYSFK